MSAAEEDTELRDLLIHTLENNGVLNKIKAELRASVFLALEEQERAENKPSLINESLRQFLATRDGRLVAGLLTDLLQHFHLDFTLAVLQPEACLPGAPEDRTSTARELGLPVPERRAPLLLELVRHFRQREAARPVPQELPPEHEAEAQAKYQLRYRDGTGGIGDSELRVLLEDLCPHFPRNMLDSFITEELAAEDWSDGIDEQRFLTLYRRLYLHCRSVVDPLPGAQLRDPLPGTQLRDPLPGTQLRDPLPGAQLRDGEISSQGQPPTEAPQLDHEDSKLDEDDLEGDSFFDDPVPKTQKTYGWKEDLSKPNGAHAGAAHSQSSISGSSKVSDRDLEGALETLKELRSTSEKMASLELGAGNDEDYLDDFHSSSQRSEKSELSIGEDLEEELSVDDLTVSDHKLEELTLDNSLSHLSDVADYLEDVS